MGSLYRSEEMCLCQLFLQTDAAYNSVAELGELGLVQFRDLNPDVSAFQRKFVNEVRRCDEMERKLRFLEKEIKKDEISMLDTRENPDAPLLREMVDLEATFEKLENELREVNKNEEMLKKNFLDLTELKHVLRKTQAFYDEREDVHAYESLAVNAANGNGTTGVVLSDSVVGGGTDVEKLQGAKRELNFVTGVILRERLLGFERLLWRACRGNVFLRLAEITEPLEDPTSGDEVNKSVFIIFYQGDQLKTRVKKICEGFRATLYPCPETPQDRSQMAIGVMTRIEDLKSVIGQTQDHRHRVLVAAAKNIRNWYTKVLKMKSIYHTLNLFNLDVTQKCLIAECWCPTSDMDKIQLALKRGTDESGSTVPSILNRMNADEMPPTYHRVNKFTRGFQNIVDSYGIATYREVNPAPYTIITFPFLFAVMFGDVGHGVIMLLAALFLVLKEKSLEARRINDEIFQTFFGGRYIVLLMGCFSIYTGLIYNDFFSKSINIFGSRWLNPYDEETWVALDEAEEHSSTPLQIILPPLYSYQKEEGPYPFGIDPVWSLAANKLNFLNSLKMKTSIIIGISQMTFGVVLSLMNYRYFKSTVDIFTMFIPQILFLGCIFIYLCLQVIIKWLYFYVEPANIFGRYYPGSYCAPSLLIGLINMFMLKSRGEGFVRGPPGNFSRPVKDNELDQCYLQQWYPGQSTIEMILLLVAVLCIPVMLLVKPFYLRFKHNRQSRHPVNVRANMNNDNAEVVHREKAGGGGGHGGGHGGHGDGEFNFGDVMVYQAIHTIEFALGCISHTASYLRLWALSLAHAQLSDVMWTMLLRVALSMKGIPGSVATYIIFFPFFHLTVSILVLMEGLSAFLHALRLHWVEFQSKFYGGLGYQFIPFSFDIILEEARAAQEGSS